MIDGADPQHGRRQCARCTIVGCGTVAEEYVRTLSAVDDLRIVACHDADRARGEAFGARFHRTHIPDLDDLLEHDHDVTINLTPPWAHAEVTRRAIRAGRSVYSEKPLALEVEEASKLLEEARAAGVLVGCAPDTFMGPAVRSARRALDAGDIGTPVAALASMLSPGPERWHHDPEHLHRAGIGPLVDMGPYYVTTLVALLGPILRVAGAHSTRVVERTILSGPRSGQTFTSEVSTHVAAVLEFADGQPASLTLSFDAPGTRTPHIEVHGTDGTLVLPDPNFFEGPVWLRARRADEWRELACPSRGPTGRGMGVADLVLSLLCGTPQRASGNLGLHVLEVLRAIEQASQSGGGVGIRNMCYLFPPYSAAARRIE